MTTTQTRKRETAAQKAERLQAEEREIAVAAGYESPYPAPGVAPVVTIEDRCPGCRKTLFVNLQGEVKCPYERCTEHGVVQTKEGELP